MITMNCNFLVPLTIIATSSTIMSCGGESDSPTNTTTDAGADVTVDGATGGSAGGNATGGAAGTGGESGKGGNATGGAAGTGGDPGAECPKDKPELWSLCNHEVSRVCSYASDNCRCIYGGRWQCTSCPADKPVENTTCHAGYQLDTCNYVDETCTCSGTSTEAKWNCSKCPATEPKTGDACNDTGKGAKCNFGKRACECTSDLKWSCEGCPDTKPTAGAECTDSSDYCVFGPSTCICDKKNKLTPGKWVCENCPSPLPADNTECAIDSVILCRDAGNQCTCSSKKKWMCEHISPP